jgi:cupin fold WbuC family metalloprotein
MNHNFHVGPDDNPHRFLNVLLRGTYIRPHRHADPPKAESFLVLEGAAELILFDDAGRITERYQLGMEARGGKTWGVDLAAGIWHTIVAVTDRVVCFEVKPGPWEPSSDKEFATWAPAEGASGAGAYLEGLMEKRASVSGSERGP